MKTVLKKTLSTALIALFLVSMFAVSGVISNAAAKKTYKIEGEAFSSSKAIGDDKTAKPEVKDISINNAKKGTYVSSLEKVAVTYKMPANFEEGNYTLTIHYMTPCNDGKLAVSVDGKDQKPALFQVTNSEGAWDWARPGDWDLGKFDLKKDSTITMSATGNSPYIQIDYLTLTQNSSAAKGTTAATKDTKAASTDTKAAPKTGVAVPFACMAALAVSGVVALTVSKKH